MARAPAVRRMHCAIRYRQPVADSTIDRTKCAELTRRARDFVTRPSLRYLFPKSNGDARRYLAC